MTTNEKLPMVDGREPEILPSLGKFYIVAKDNHSYQLTTEGKWAHQREAPCGTHWHYSPSEALALAFLHSLSASEQLETESVTPANRAVEAAGRSEAGYRSITLKLAAFCARLSGHDGVPHDVAREGMRLTHEFKAVERGEAGSVEGRIQKAAKDKPTEPGYYFCDPNFAFCDPYLLHWDGRRLCYLTPIGEPDGDANIEGFTNFRLLINERK